MTGESSIGAVVAALVFGFGAVISLTGAASYNRQSDDNTPAEPVTTRRPRAHSEDEDRVSDPGWGLVLIGAIAHVFLSARSRMKRLTAPREKYSGAREDTLWVEPNEPAADPAHGVRRAISDAPVLRADPPPRPPAQPKKIAPEQIYTEPEAPRIAPPPAPIKAGRRAEREAQPSLLGRPDYELPPLALLTEPKKSSVGKLSPDALEQNARLLEGVLDDFGVKGEIINVRPGPVVTLYELEPAPGIKSSRVIGLADDIARSMSAISARVAVVQGETRLASNCRISDAKRSTCVNSRPQRISRRPSTSSRLRSAKPLAANLSSWTSPGCRTSLSPARPGQANPLRSIPLSCRSFIGCGR